MRFLIWPSAQDPLKEALASVDKVGHNLARYT